MDQGPLVAEQIDAGAKLANEYNRVTPLQAAFWLKKGENGQWYLYLVSEKIDDTNFGAAYGEVHRILGRGPHLWLDPFQVKVAGVDHPIAKGVLDIQHQYPSASGTRLRNLMLGGATMDEVYIYPLPVSAPA